MVGQKILVPYNFTANDQKAIDFVIRMFKDRDEIDITLFHAFTPAPEVDVQNNPIMEKMSRNLSYLRQKIHGDEARLKAAREVLLASGFAANRVQCVFQPGKRDIAQDILDRIRDDGYDTVVLNRTAGKMTRFFSGNVFTKVVLAVADVTVLIVT
jgi:hypothetical protein